ncbi:hypothetical protein [Chitinophaga defluvii]|uniref:Secreted protein n=1 Tax=Chitinophaga defluvii TaxID=3163343 RepID=A0ABV2T0B5_9BACT
MRKQSITVLLMLIWLCQLSGRYFVMLDFYINQNYIAKNLCINRDKPQMHCNGKCSLKKKLNEEDRKNQENPERKAENRSEIFYPLITENRTVPQPETINTIYTHPDCIGTPIDQPAVIFHPPAV